MLMVLMMIEHRCQELGGCSLSTCLYLTLNKILNAQIWIVEGLLHVHHTLTFVYFPSRLTSPHAQMCVLFPWATRNASLMFSFDRLYTTHSRLVTVFLILLAIMEMKRRPEKAFVVPLQMVSSNERKFVSILYPVSQLNLSDFHQVVTSKVRPLQVAFFVSS